MGGRIGRAVFHLAVTVLVLLLAGRTYQETAIAHARSAGSLRKTWAVVVDTASHTRSGQTGGGQDGGERPFTSHTYAVELRLGKELKTVDDVGYDAMHELTRGQQVEVGLWHGRVVEIGERDVWPGWHVAALDGTLFVLYPPIMAYLIALAVSARTYMTSRSNGVRLTREDRLGAFWSGFLVGLAEIAVLIVCAAFGNGPVYWPVIPIGAGALVAVVRLRLIADPPLGKVPRR
ncbi:hypothetical protein HUT19_34200 [Streptomyces sp. NA02950]|uniref:hypothetical protein n=1 Tax=Streptomyces sp. NA02950 TaxID=2742137 RepID=UPI00158FCCB4|nr:hypothetical protein [Streptomyces sp. NA02950]QKV96153.1 hypothetical protein HUT19_34200 [Streptomyces sp. NA02950]